MIKTALGAGAVALLLSFSAQADELIVRKPLDAAGERFRAKSIREYKIKQYTHLQPLAWPVNEYFCRRTSGLGREDAMFEFDDRGLPLRRHPRGTFYHPISLARNVISVALTYMNTGHPALYYRTVDAADKLIEIMGPDGAFRYEHPYNVHYYGVLESGWTSSMAQGSALSAFARAYHVTCDPKYREAGDKALAYLLMPIEKGGTSTTLRFLHPSLAKYVWYEEYPNPDKPAYTLNGFLYTILGMYDFAEATGSKEARKAFDDGVRSLEQILPLFDHDGLSAYDLAPIVYDKPVLFNSHYHNVHLMQLSALYAITKRQIFEDYRARWYETVGGPIAPCGSGQIVSRKPLPDRAQ